MTRLSLLIRWCLLLATVGWGALPHQVAWAHDVTTGLSRYNPDGTLDGTFKTSGLVAVRAQDQAFPNALAIQADDKIVAVGAISNLSTGVVQFSIVRYTEDGSPDTTFGATGAARTSIVGMDAEAHAVAVQSDGKIVVAGTAFSKDGRQDQFAVARYNPDGILDASFGSSGVVSTSVGLGSSEARGLAVQPDGKIVVAGTAFDNGPTEYDFGLVRYNPDGSLDTTFGVGGIVTTDFGPVEGGTDVSIDRAQGVALQADGDIVVVGAAGGRLPDFAVARYREDGTLDPSFGLAGRAIARFPGGAQASAVSIQPDGDIVVAGSAHSTSGGTPIAAVRFKSDGNLDPNFGSGGLVVTEFDGGSSGAHTVAVQGDGMIVVGGGGYGPPLRDSDGQEVQNGGFALVRYRADGSLDNTFGSGGRVLTTLGDAGATINAVGLQHDGRIVAAGLVSFRVLSTNPAPVLGP